MVRDIGWGYSSDPGWGTTDTGGYQRRDVGWGATAEPEWGAAGDLNWN
jgi:hypothetical protein